MAEIRTVLFDLDGTLIDSIALILASYRHMEAAHGLSPRTDDEWMAGVGTPLTSQFACWDDGQGRMDALIASYRAFNLANHDRMVREFPGVLDAVRRIRAAGRATGLVTSKVTPSALRGLRLVGLEPMMDVLVCADQVANPKPHPEPVLLAVSLLRADPAATLFVGDSIHDLHAGRAAGVLTAAVLWGPFSRAQLEPAEPDFWLAHPDELVALAGA